MSRLKAALAAQLLLIDAKLESEPNVARLCFSREAGDPHLCVKSCEF